MEFTGMMGLTGNDNGTHQQVSREIDILRDRLDLLSGLDRTLMTMHLENGATFRQMAQLAGVNEATVARRVRRLIRGLGDEKYVTVLRHPKLFTRSERTLLADHYLSGQPMREIARRRRCTYYKVRQTVQRVETLLKPTTT